MCRSAMPPMEHMKYLIEPKGAHFLRPHKVHQALGILGVPMDTAGFLPPSLLPFLPHTEFVVLSMIQIHPF